VHQNSLKIKRFKAIILSSV